MVAILRVVTRWSGFNGAPGYTNLFFRDFGTGEGPGTDGDATQAAAATAKVRTFWDSAKAILPNEVSLTVEPVVDLLEDTTGELQDSFTVAAPAVVNGTGTGSFSGPVGMVINWRTASIRNGRRIRGRTFIVPTTSLVMSATGGVSPTEASILQGNASTLASSTGSPDLGVWARPTSPTATDGQWAVCTGATVPTLAAVLRSRRD